MISLAPLMILSVFEAQAAPPLIDLDPLVNFTFQIADMLGACHTDHHVSVEADLSNWSHHYMTETPYTDVHIQWRNMGAPAATWVSPLERHRAHVDAAVEAINTHMATLRPAVSWRPLVVDYHDNHSVIRHSGREGFLQMCRIQNRSLSPLEITLDKVIKPCVDRYMKGRELLWTEERFSAITVRIPPQTSSMSLLEVLELGGDQLVWYFTCKDMSGAGGRGDSCILSLGSKAMQEYRGTLDLLKSYQLLGGTTGCDLMP